MMAETAIDAANDGDWICSFFVEKFDISGRLKADASPTTINKSNNAAFPIIGWN